MNNKYYTRKEARENYDVLTDWSDWDFEMAESNWIEHCRNCAVDENIDYTVEDYIDEVGHEEPYSIKFLDWCLDKS